MNTRLRIALAIAFLACALPSTALADDLVSATGPAEAACLASGSGAAANGCFGPSFAVSGTGSAGADSCWKSTVSVSVQGTACGAPDGAVLWQPSGLEGVNGESLVGIAVSGTNTASSDGVAISGTNAASSDGVAISGTGTAKGGLLRVSGGGPLNAPAPTCTARSDAPHFSRGAGGVIVKGRTTCSNSMPEVRLDTYLFRCPAAPPAGTTEGCTRVADGHRNIPNPTNGMQYTDYAPKQGDPGLKGPSWWVGCVQVFGYNNRGQEIHRAENISAPYYI